MRESFVVCGDCFDIMLKLPDGYINAVITDPPYGMGLFATDKRVDVALFAQEVYRLLSDDGFFAFFGQMPYVLDWLVAADELFQFKEHISWVKRTVTPSHRLSRGHEEIFIYSKGGSSFYSTKGKYEDVKVPGVMFDTISIEGVKRYISVLWRRIDTGHIQMRTLAKVPRRDCFARFHGETVAAPRFANFTNVWSFSPPNQKTYNKGGKEHPCAKPLEIMKRLVEMLTTEDGIVLDPFLGVGTTAVACIEIGRRYVGVEIDRKFCAIAKRRIKEVRL